MKQRALNFSEVYQWNMTLNAWVLIDDACRINEYKSLGRVSPCNFHDKHICFTATDRASFISGIKNDTCDQSTVGESEGYAQEWIKSIIATYQFK